ncbi:MAG: hypothetical protein ACTSRP_01875 [Candidatus Helarchaeota archaeon]
MLSEKMDALIEIIEETPAPEIFNRLGFNTAMDVDEILEQYFDEPFDPDKLKLSVLYSITMKTILSLMTIEDKEIRLMEFKKIEAIIFTLIEEIGKLIKKIKEQEV